MKDSTQTGGISLLKLRVEEDGVRRRTLREFQGLVWGSLACEMVEPCSPPWSLWQIATWWPVLRVVASPTARGQATLLRYITLQTPLTFEMKLITRRPAASESWLMVSRMSWNIGRAYAGGETRLSYTRWSSRRAHDRHQLRGWSQQLIWGFTSRHIMPFWDKTRSPG